MATTDTSTTTPTAGSVPTLNDLITAQQTAVESVEASAATLGQFIANDASTPVTVADNVTVPSLAAIAAQALAAASVRTYELNWSQSSIGAYANAATPLYNVLLGHAATFPKDLAGSIFKLATAASTAITLSLTFGSVTYAVTFPANSTSGQVTALTGDSSVATGSTLSATITSAVGTAAGLSITLVGTVNTSS